MKEQLTIQELSAYLPWGVQCHVMGEVVEDTEYDENPIPKTFTVNGTFLDSHNDRFVIIENEMDNTECTIEECFMLLYPISHLTKSIEHKGERFVPIEKILEYFGYEVVMYNGKLAEPISMMPYVVVQKLLEWHFAVNIPENLYIDKTTI